MVQMAAVAIPCGIQMKIIWFTLVWHTIFSEMLHLKIQKNAGQNSPTRMFSTATFSFN